MTAHLDIKITGPSGTKHQKMVTIGGKTYRMTTTATAMRKKAEKAAKSKIRVMPKLGMDLAR